MNKPKIFPPIVNVTDLRYRWSSIEDDLANEGGPIVVVDHSTPKAVIFAFDKAQQLFGQKNMIRTEEDPLVKWRAKYAAKFADWDATAVIRRQRNLRWKLS